MGEMIKLLLLALTSLSLLAQDVSPKFIGEMSGTGNVEVSLVNPHSNRNWFPNLSNVAMGTNQIPWPNLNRTTYLVSIVVECAVACSNTERAFHDVSIAPSGVAGTAFVGYQNSQPKWTQVRTGMTNAGTTGRVMYVFSGSAVNIPVGLKLKPGEAFSLVITTAGTWTVRYVFEER
jgi:hypothetical protein